jgi:hypothetical protein
MEIDGKEVMEHGIAGNGEGDSALEQDRLRQRTKDSPGLKRRCAMEEEGKVIIEIPLEGEIKIYPVGKCETLPGLRALNSRIKKMPIKKMTAFEGIGVMRYENCY